MSASGSRKLSESRTARTALVGAIGAVVTVVVSNIELPASLLWLRGTEMITAVSGLVLAAAIYIATIKNNEIKRRNSQERRSEKPEKLEIPELKP